MIVRRVKLFSVTSCKICAHSNKAPLLPVPGRWFSSHAKFSSVTAYRKNTLLVPVHWWNGYQKFFLKSFVSCKIPSWAGESWSRVNPVYLTQLRKKNTLAQPKDSEVKGPVNKLAGAPSHELCEGPVVHHSAAAALVATNHQNKQHLKEVPHCSKVAASEENLGMSEQSTEELLSSTTAYIRRISATDELDFHLKSSENQSRDIEYVVEQRPAFSAKPQVKLTGAVPPSARDWRAMDWNLADLPSIYAALAKSRLTALVVATALGGYVLAPAPLTMATLLGSVAGTGLVSAAANATNQVLEVPYDAQMSRTANRVLVRGIVSPVHAACFASTCGVGGIALLLGLCGPAAAGLGLLNLALYTAVYTPLKRRTIVNTWVGALVGAIPPLIGWCGCGGPLIGAEAWGAWLMAGLLFAWQFPHFNALSWNLRADYSRAGYRMMCVTDPRLCKATCVRYSAALLLLSVAAPALSVTTWTFAVDSAPLNAYMLYLSYRFYKDGDSRSARNLFRFSLLHLPAVMVLLLISKKWRSAASEEAVPPHYAASVVYNKKFSAQTIPTIVAAAAQTGVPCPETDSQVPGVSSSTAASEVPKLEGNAVERVAGSVASELKQGVVFSIPGAKSSNLYEVPKVVHFSGKLEDDGCVGDDVEGTNGKTTLDVLVEQGSR